MTLRHFLPLALVLPFLAGCDDDPEHRKISMQVAGTGGWATIQYESGHGIQVLENQALPVIVDLSAEVGETVRMYASVPNLNATLWILILEEGEIVASSPSCLCNGNFVSAEAGGVVGHW